MVWQHDAEQSAFFIEINSKVVKRQALDCHRGLSTPSNVYFVQKYTLIVSSRKIFNKMNNLKQGGVVRIYSPKF